MKDLESVLIVPKTILNLAGRWPEKYPRTTFSRAREILFIIVEIVFNLMMMAEIFKIFEDFSFDILFEILALCITTTAHSFKMILFKVHTSEWLVLLDQLKSKYFTDYPRQFNTVNEKFVFFSRNVGNLFQFGCFCSTTMYILAPFFSSAELPVRFSYLSKEYLVYIYIFQSFATGLCAMTHSSIDVLITDFIGISVGQLNVLIEKINAFATKEFEAKIDLNECVEHHIKIIRFLHKLESAASGIIMVEYTKSALVFCFLGIQAVTIDPMSAAFARIVVYGLAIIFQLMIYCFFANEILTKSVEVGDACYTSLWYEIDQKYKTALILIMERSKRQLYLTAGKISIVSLQSFTSIMKSSYTYFALMKTLYKKDSENGMN